MEEALANDKLGKNPYLGLDLGHLFEIRSGLQDEVKQLQRLIQNANEAIEARVEAAVKAKRQEQKKETGIVEVEVDGLEVAHDVPKRVEWLQDELKKAMTDMFHETGRCLEANEYEVKYSIPERTYQKFSEMQRFYVDKARVVKHGKVGINLREKK